MYMQINFCNQAVIKTKLFSYMITCISITINKIIYYLQQRSFDDFQEVSEEFDRAEEIQVRNKIFFYYTMIKVACTTKFDQIEPPLAKIRKTDIQEVKPKKRISVRKQEMPLPKPFEVPHNFTPNVEDALESKSLNGKTRAKFITLIAQSIYRFSPCQLYIVILYSPTTQIQILPYF